MRGVRVCQSHESLVLCLMPEVRERIRFAEPSALESIERDLGDCIPLPSSLGASWAEGGLGGCAVEMGQWRNPKLSTQSLGGLYSVYILHEPSVLFGEF